MLYLQIFNAQNRPFPSSPLSLLQNESKCETFLMKMISACSFIFMQIKVIFIRMVSQLLVYSYFCLRNRLIIAAPSFSTRLVFKEKNIFSVHTKLKAGRFNFLRFEERFGKAPF